MDPVEIWHLAFDQNDLSHGNGPEITELPGHDPARFQKSSGKPPISIRRLAWHHWRSPYSQWPFNFHPANVKSWNFCCNSQSHTEWSENKRETHKLYSSPNVCALAFSYESHSSFIMMYGFYIFIIFSHTSHWGPRPLSFICLNSSPLREDKSVRQL